VVLGGYSVVMVWWGRCDRRCWLRQRACCGLALVSVGVVLGGTGGLEVMIWSSGGD
jgi:hypothetical protein